MIKTNTATILSCILIFSFTPGLNFKNIHPTGEEREFQGKFSCPDSPSFSEIINQKKNLHSNSAETEKIVGQNWYSKVIKNIVQDEYDFSYNEELKSYQSSNPKNNIRFTYHNDGFTAKRISEWSIDFKTQDLRRSTRHAGEAGKTQEGNNEKQDSFCHSPESGNPGNININYTEDSQSNGESFTFKGSELKINGNTAFIEDDNMRINYTNEDKGMRQDFIIKKKVDGEGQLRLNITAGTKLKMIVGADALMFKDNYGDDKMKYSELKCWDANGVELRAYFESSLTPLHKKGTEGEINPFNSKSSNSISKSFSIVVNDENAVYPITIDPLSTSPNWSVEGNTGEALGSKVTTAGDVNGDGYSDVLVSLGDSVICGYYGSSTGLPLLPDWQARSFGFSSISTAGDVNADGYSDIIIGDGAFSVQGPFNGRALAYYGSATGLPLIPSWTVYDSSNADGAQFGSSVSTAGDVNGDGYSDVIVGAPYYSNDVNNEGAVFCYFGSSTGLSLTANWTVEGNSPGQSFHFGEAVSLAGDVNGDGYSDILVGAPNYNLNKGKVNAYYGSSTGLSDTVNWTTQSTQSGEVYGSSLSTAGDINGDGYSDIIIGARGFDGGESEEGKVYVYHGSSSGISVSITWTAEGNQNNSNFGYSVSSSGDINGDGYSDILIGANIYTNSLSNQGRGYMYQGSSAGLPGSPNWITEGEQANSFCGSSLFTAGDVNGDGYSDVIIGSPGYSSNKGKAYVHNGAAAGLTTDIGWSTIGESTTSSYGFSVSTAGDVNGDGYSDVIVGAYSQQISSQQRGRAYVFHGSSSGLSLTPSWIAQNNQVNSQFGYCVATAGDVNGDGYSDVIIGSPFYDNDQTNEGRAYVYYGSSSGLSASPGWTGESNIEGSLYSFSVATAGDVNGDGYSDIIVGQYGANTSYAYYGSPTGLSATESWTASGESFFGICVSTAGDVNGDGYDDVIVGSNGDGDRGKAYAFYGSQTGLSLTTNWTRSGFLATDNFSWSVACAGDVNGDGYSDIIIGAKRFNNTGFAYAGGAFAYYGSSTGLSGFTNWSVQGDNFNTTHFGLSVSTAGDVNGDGYSDVIVGAPNPGGKAYAYYGSGSGLSSGPNWTINSVFYGNVQRFGNSVSSAGDINGDGYSDVIVGAYFNIGKTFMYYGNEGAGLRTTVQQFKPGTSDVVSSGGLTGTDGSVRFNIFGSSFYGRGEGKIVYDYKQNGIPFNPINNTTNSGSGNFSDLGITGGLLVQDVSGLLPEKVYKWRARVQYDQTKNPYQKFAPWRYYNSYIPTPTGNFRPSDGIPPVMQLNLTMFIQGFYRADSNAMVRDTIKVYLRNSSSPFSIVDSSKAYMNTDGTAIFDFPNAANGVNYYLDVQHRNSIRTWSTTAESFVDGILSYNFSNAPTKAYGGNEIEVDLSPAIFAFYSGDVNQDEFVNLNDLILTYNNSVNFVNGYVVTDVNGDDVTNLQDILITFNNTSLFVVSIHP